MQTLFQRVNKETGVEYEDLISMYDTLKEEENRAFKTGNMSKFSHFSTMLLAHELVIMSYNSRLF